MKSQRGSTANRPVNNIVHAGAAFLQKVLGRQKGSSRDGASRASGQDMHDAARLKRCWSFEASRRASQSEWVTLVLEGDEPNTSTVVVVVVVFEDKSVIIFVVVSVAPLLGPANPALVSVQKLNCA